MVVSKRVPNPIHIQIPNVQVPAARMMSLAQWFLINLPMVSDYVGIRDGMSVLSSVL
jgi:hypothetical protein